MLERVLSETVMGELAFDTVAGAARALSEGISALDHKALDDSVEYYAVIEMLVYKRNEVIYSVGSVFGIKLSMSIVTRGFLFSIFVLPFILYFIC